MDDYKQANLALWNEWAALHENSDFYDLASFKTGRNSLRPLELAEVGSVAGKSLLHLQCHFGMDSLSWARLGAQVTGVDFSDKAISLAQGLSEELNIPAHFMQSDVLELPQVLNTQFDIVFTSYGVLMWLPDLTRWGQVVAHFLKPGGFFYIAEIHPFAMIFDNDKDVKDFKIKYPYFHDAQPLRFEVEGSYADTSAEIKQKVDYEWVYTIGDVITALAQAGLRIEFLHEWPFVEYQMLGLTEKTAAGDWRLTQHAASVPLMFSLKATK
jgi:2-polyprenyl-3-methyl-5-hydroxy-6-metoxy-1,4-benzoquinol methylase